MPRLRDILYDFAFTEAERTSFTFSDDTKIRLNSDEHRIQLKADANGKYSTDNDLWVKTGLFWPKSGKAWRGFYADTVTPEDTSIGFKLNDDTDDYYWDGGVWSVAGASDWNTEGDVATNIASFDKRKFRVVINLKTTDETATPYLSSIRVGFQARIVFLEQWIYRTLVPLLRNNIRPLAAWPIPKGVTGTTIDLNDFELDAPFNLIDVDSVFNHTDDPEHETDILLDYDTGTKIITLTTSVDAGKVVWIDFEYEPEVAALTSVDYHELHKVPAITIENLRIGEAIRNGLKNELINKADHTKALQYEPPWQCQLLGDLVIQAPRSLDEMALAEEVLAFISENQSVEIPGTGETVDWFVPGGSYYGRDVLVAANDLRVARISFEMRWLKAWLRPVKGASEGVYSITNMELTYNVAS